MGLSHEMPRFGAAAAGAPPLAASFPHVVLAGGQIIPEREGAVNG